MPASLDKGHIVAGLLQLSRQSCIICMTDITSHHLHTHMGPIPVPQSTMSPLSVCPNADKSQTQNAYILYWVYIVSCHYFQYASVNNIFDTRIRVKHWLRSGILHYLVLYRWAVFALQLGMPVWVGNLLFLHFFNQVLVGLKVWRCYTPMVSWEDS